MESQSQHASPQRPRDGRVRLRPESRRKWEAICRAKRWTLTEAGDALADAFIEAEGIEVPDGGSRTS